MAQSYAGPYYGNSIASGMAQSPIAVLYIPIVRNISQPEFEEYMEDVNKQVLKYNPKTLVSLDKDFLKYLPAETQNKYRNSYHFIQTFNLMCEKINYLISSSDRQGVPVYVLVGTQSISRDTDDLVSSCIHNSSEKYIYPIQTLQDLKTTIVKLQSEERGFIVSAVNYVRDTEFNVVEDRGTVNAVINKLNRVHTTIGKYSYTNLDIALRPEYDKKLEIRILINPKNLQSDDEHILLRNILPVVQGTIVQ